MSGPRLLLWAIVLVAAVVFVAVGLLSLRPLGQATEPPARQPDRGSERARGDHDRGSAAATPARGGGEPAPAGGAAALRGGGEVLAAVWTGGRWALLVLCVTGSALLASRFRHRRARRMWRFLLVPGRASEASPAQIAGFVEALGSVTRQRWWIRLWRGTPPAATLELVAGVGPGGAREQRIGIAIPSGEGHLEAIRGVLVSRYPDATLRPLGEDAGEGLRPWLKEVVRLKKAKPFTMALDRPSERSLVSAEPYQEASSDTLLAVMAEVGERVLVQIAITPVPDRFRDASRHLAVGPKRSAREAPLPDAVQQREERSSTDAIVFRPLSWADIRVGAESYRAARHVAGAIQGQTEGGENRLRQRRALLRRHLYIERMVRAESNPLPSWMHGVYSSLEIAGIWQIPTAFAKTVAIERSSVPQLATPPEVYRPSDESKAVATDLRGNFVGLRSEDWKYGFQVSGAAGGGKTSILARVGAVRAREPNTAVIVLDPKGELAEAVAAVAPSWRTVRFLDIARPLFGIALETPERDLSVEAEIFSEAMVDVSRTEEGDSQALNASQRSFKMARGATLALESDPTFWHTARWLASDDEAAEWRKKKIEKLAGDPQWHAVWDHFARILPAQLQKSPSQAVMRLEAPYNKIQTLLGDERLNAVLHHPVRVSFADVIRKREVLLVAARVPDHPDAAVFLKFAVQLIHRAILAQQKLPEEERARVAVIGDDAGNLFSPTIAAMMENDRSAGLDLALGWQHGGQVRPELAEAVDSLCNSRIYLRSGEKDAERAINRLNPAFEARISGGLGELKRTRVEINQLTGLDLRHGVAVLQAGKRLSSSFTIVTLPWHADAEKLAAFEKRVEQEGGYDPEAIVPPAELTGRGANEEVRDFGGDSEGGEPAGGGEDAGPPPAEAAPSGPPEASPAPAGAEAPEPPRAEPTRQSAPAEKSPARAQRRGRRQAEVAQLGTPTNKPLSPGYQEVELLRDHANSIRWENPKPEPPQLRHNEINDEQKAILEALFELRVLTAGQIQRDFLVSSGERQARRELALLVRQRMVKRGEISLKETPGRGRRVYVLDSEGFALLRDNPYHSASGRWEARELRSAQHVVHDLARNEWLWGFRSLAPRQLVRWWGSRSGKIEVPLVKAGRAPARLLELGDLRENAPIDFGGTEFANLVPDLKLQLELRRPSGEAVEVDMLVELEWGNSDDVVRKKAITYDGLMTGWWQEHAHYKKLGRPPIVFFVVPDAKRAARFIEILDETLTSYVLGPAATQTKEQHQEGVTPQAKKIYFGRRNTFVAVARDISQRTLRAWRVPAELPDDRATRAGNARERHAAKKPIPTPYMLINARELVDPAA